ncbi:PspC domain-containing protein [Lutibacter citreus]|uniref:PspC domain-containing protein n=1 Tax=Lutibacter citreus TaxID=2138210 RepID=UPI000DBE2984|nr:PspC domain-containing protein [Lutibacter citreus]
MNKTININLGGIFFHIDEIAYQKLKRYLDAIRRSLSDDPQGRDEILNDIEHRIGELLSERVKDTRQVINENDIDQVTKIMGKPEDYLVDEEIFEDQPKYRSKTPTKKLFRDSEDKFLGGVCSGLGHYFGIDSIWMRIIWIVLTFPSGGATILIYILLWILLPQANSTAEKLQMKGEPVNISNIEKKIREEFNEVSSRVKDGVNDVSEKMKNSEFKKKVNSNSKSGFEEIIDTLGTILITLFKVFGKLIGALLIFIAAATLIGLIIGAFSLGSFEILGFGEEFVHYPNFFLNSVLPHWLLAIFVFIAIGIPFVILFILGLKILTSNTKSISSTTKLSLLGVWIISILGLGFAGINFAAQNSSNGVFKHTEELPFVTNDTLRVKMIDDENLSNNDELRRRHDFETVYDNNVKKLYSSSINVDIKSTDKPNAFVKIRKESSGKTRLTANNDAESIEYEFNLSNKDLLLNGYFLSDFKNLVKEQEIDITIYLPINTVIYLDKSTRTFLDDVDNIQDVHDNDMPKNHFKMTEDGLECLDCDPTIISDKYKKKKDNFKLNIDRNGVEIKVNDGENNAEIKIDENGMKIQ